MRMPRLISALFLLTLLLSCNGKHNYVIYLEIDGGSIRDGDVGSISFLAKGDTQVGSRVVTNEMGQKELDIFYGENNSVTISVRAIETGQYHLKLKNEGAGKLTLRLTLIGELTFERHDTSYKDVHLDPMHNIEISLIMKDRSERPMP